MMKIREALLVVGNNRLDQFNWGGTLTIFLNQYFPNDQQFSVGVTGTQLTDKINGLSEQTSAFLMELEVPPVAPVPAITPEPARPAAATPAPASDDEPITDPHDGNYTNNGKVISKNVWGLIIMGTFLFIALMFSFSMAYTSIQNGTAPDASFLKPIVDAMIEVFKAFNESGQSQ